MQMAAGYTIGVGDELADDAAQTSDVEAGVLDFEGIEGPFDGVNALTETMFALLQLQRATDAAIAIFGEHGEKMRMDIRRSGMMSAETERETDETVVVKCAQDVTAGLSGDDEDGDGDEVGVRIAPDLALEIEAGFEFGEGIAGTNYKIRGNRLGHRSRGGGWPLVSRVKCMLQKRDYSAPTDALYGDAG